MSRFASFLLLVLFSLRGTAAPLCASRADCATKTREYRHALQGGLRFNFDLYLRACSFGDALACVFIAEQRQHAWPIPEKESAAVAAPAGGAALAAACPADPHACFGTALIALHGLGQPRDEERAVTFFRTACDGKHAEACFFLGEEIVKGGAVEPSAETAFDAYEKGCGNGHALSCMRAAKLAMRGLLLPREPRPDPSALQRRGQELWKANLAVTKRSCLDSYDSGCLLEAEKNPPAFREWLHLSCSWGALPACHTLGEHQRLGIAETKSDTEALKLFRWSCAQGFALSCLRAGMLDDSNPDDHILFRTACDGGSPMGCCYYASFVLVGVGRYGPWRDLPAIYRRARLNGAAPLCLGMETHEG